MDDRDEVRAVFATVLADPPPLGFTPADIERAARRRPRWAIALAAAAAVVLIAAGAVVLQRGGNSAAPPAGGGTVESSAAIADRVLREAARRAGLTVDDGPFVGTQGPPNPLPGEAEAGGRYSNYEGSTLLVRDAAGGTGLLWTQTSYGEIEPVPAVREADSCKEDASVMRTEDACRIVEVDGIPVRVAHHGGTRPHDIWTAYFQEPGQLVEVALSTAAPYGDDRQLTVRPFSDQQLADLVVHLSTHR